MTEHGADLGAGFYDRPVLDVAPDLLNKVLVTAAGDRSGRIVEVEAYGGTDDPASHGWRGPTPRTVPMFGAGGHWYVYLSYGVHWCANVVCGPEGVCAAVLIRAIEPIAGVDAMQAARGPKVATRNLTNGPGKLTQAMGVGGALDGTRIAVSGLRIVYDEVAPPTQPRRTPRIGIHPDRAADRLWRFLA